MMCETDNATYVQNHLDDTAADRSVPVKSFMHKFDSTTHLEK